MINHLQVATVFVKDMDQAITFYTDKLGFAVHVDLTTDDGFRWVEVAPEGAQTTIALSVPWPGMPEGAIGSATGLIFDTDDAHASAKALKQKGVTLLQEPTEKTWGGIEARFADPFGNEFSLVQDLTKSS